MKIALAQINTRVGDITSNLARIIRALGDAKSAGAEIVLFPELTLPGYPPEDFVEKKAFVRKNLEALDEAVRHTRGIAAVLGFVDPNPTGQGRPTYNAAAWVDDGKVTVVAHKTLLPNYDVFDEMRHFEPSASRQIVRYKGMTVGLSICEDAWNDKDFWPVRLYAHDPIEELAQQGCQLLINISASPFSVGKSNLRRRMFQNICTKYRTAAAMCNLVGGNDSLIFDGSSFVMNAKGELTGAAASFEESLLVADTEGPSIQVSSMDENEEIFSALRLGVRDYMSKCGFRKAIIGLSGGIDSAVVAAITASAIGAENVTGVSMPSRYSSDHSRSDAAALARNLNIRFEEVSIEPMFQAFLNGLQAPFKDAAEDITEENLQARIRGNILMAMSNKWNAMVLSTGNKSELAVGYCTIYGDMCGGLAVISDVPKTMVYRLAHWINRNGEIIPQNTILKPPSAELRPGQTDQDSLPPYEILDGILNAYIEDFKEESEIVALGFDAETVRNVLKRVDRNEYKRRQAAPGLRITTKAFGFGRRLPIAQGWR